MSSNDDINYSDVTCEVCGSLLQKKFSLTSCKTFKSLNARCSTCNKYVPFSQNMIVKTEVSKDCVTKLEVKERLES